MTQQTPKVDGIFKPITQALENMHNRCEESLLATVKSSPGKFLNSHGDVRVEGRNFVIEEAPKKRIFEVQDMSKIDREFLTLNEDAVREYYDTLGILPEGVTLRVEREFNVCTKKTSSKD